MEKQITHTAPDSGTATRTGQQVIDIRYGTAMICGDPQPGRTLDQPATVSAFRTLVKQDLTKSFGDTGWSLDWHDTKPDTALSVLVNGAPATTPEESAFVDAVTAAVTAVRTNGDYLVYSS